MKSNTKQRLTIVYLNYSSFSYSQISIGIASIYTYLSNNNIKVNIIDTSTFNNIDEVVEQVNAFNDNYVGISTTELHFNLATEIAQKLKCKDKSVILGGIFPSLFPEKCLSYNFFDYVCVGDGEYTLLNLIQGILPSKIQGLWFRVGKKIINNGTSINFNLNDFTITDYTGFPIESISAKRDFLGNKIPMVFTWSARGCTYSCTYCCNRSIMNILGHKVRYRNVNNFTDEIAKLYEIYKTKNFFISDEDFLSSKKHVNKIIESFFEKQICNISFGFLSRPEHINKTNYNLLTRLAEIGWKWVSIGIEIGNENKRKQHLNRLHSNEKILSAFSICKQIGIKTNVFLISGFYFETIDDLILTDELLKKCEPNNVECSYYYPFQGSQLYDIYNDSNLVNKNLHPNSYFEDIVIKHPIFSHENLITINKYWNEWTIRSNIKELIRKLE